MLLSFHVYKSSYFVNLLVKQYTYQSVFTAVEVLQEQDIPHNMMITYGDPCTPHSEPTIVPEPVLRVCLWPVKPSDQVYILAYCRNYLI